MSLSIQPLKPVLVKEPRVDVSGNRMFAILKGGSRTTYKSVISTSYSNSSIQFSAVPPSPYILVDRMCLLKLKIRITFAGTTTGTNLMDDVGLNDALRAYPVSQVINTMTATINNTQVSINLSDVVNALSRYQENQLPQEVQSLTPSALDFYQDYNGWNNALGRGGSVKNALGSIGETSDRQGLRGGFPNVVITNTPTDGVIDVEITEPLFLSPFCFEQRLKNAFYGVQTLDFNISLGDLSRVWSHNLTGGSATFSSVTAVLNQAPELQFCYITPDPAMKFPNVCVYDFSDVSRYPTDVGAVVAPGVDFTVESANIQLQSIPRRIYVYARRRNADRTLNTTDTFAEIKNVSVNWANQSGLLSNASQEQLYRICSQNGCQMSYPQWKSYTGGVLALDFGKDISLQPSECPGQLGTYQLQLRASLSNLHPTDSINYTLYVVVVSIGCMTIFDNRSVSQIGVVSKDDVLNATADGNTPEMGYYEASEHNMFGGSFWGKIGNFFKKAVKFARDKIVPAVEKYGPLVKKGLQYAQMAGMGYSGGASAGVASRGAGRSGGRMLSRKQLKQRLQKY